MSGYPFCRAALFWGTVAALVTLAACADVTWGERVPNQDEKGHSGFEGGPGLGLERGQGL